MARRILVTSALPYANGPIHLGHVAGAYLPADIYVRFERLRGAEVLYICGTDEHGVPITITADKEGTSPPEVVAKYHALIGRAFAGLRIEFDIFSGTSTCPHHARLSQEFFLQIHEKGLLELRETKQLFCLTCRRFLPDRYAVGTCPVCDNPHARGDQCEKCGNTIEPHLLKNPRCLTCGSTPEVRTARHWFFDLKAFEGRLSDWLSAKTHWRANVREFSLGLVRQGLPSRSITRDIQWGIPVPLPEGKGKVLYVWFDAPIGYLSFTVELGERRGDPDLWKRFWQDPDVSMVHFIGKDNIVFHAVVWPAMLMGKGGLNLPAEIPANEFLNLGDKMSKSRGLGVFVHQVLEDFPADSLRYYLNAIAPEVKDANFTWEEFGEKVAGELIDIFGNFVNRTMTMFHRGPDGGHVPDGKDPILNEAFENIEKAKRAFGDSLENFRFRDAGKAWMDLAREGNKMFEREALWKAAGIDPGRRASAKRAFLEMTAALAVIGFPIVPESCERVFAMLGMKGPPGPEHWRSLGQPLLAVGQTLPKDNLRLLYQKAHLLQKVSEHMEAGKNMENQAPQVPDAPSPIAAAPVPPPLAVAAAAPARIPFAKFKEVELRVGEVLSAERVPKTDKLLKLRVTLGTEEREILAGIAHSYAAESLIGRQVIVVTNLEPRKIRGEVSDGMVLAGQDAQGIVVLSPERKLPPGTPIT